ncbi:MAG: HD domain-containing protein [Prevotella sp.]|nr:HD domain-containing protein [Prevotella sp.]
MNYQPSLDLMEFVEKKIIPRYTQFDAAHNMSHVTSVIRRSLNIALHTTADINMVYVVAAYHDLGLTGPRAVHHITGAKILSTDKRLLKWFTPTQIEIMSQAVEDHRASASHAPRSIYGRIVAEADRDLRPETVFQRAVIFGIDNYPQMQIEEQWQRFKKHMHEKYSAAGYIQLWIEGSENHKHLEDLRKIISDETLLHQHFLKHYKKAKKD